MYLTVVRSGAPEGVRLVFPIRTSRPELPSESNR